MKSFLCLPFCRDRRPSPKPSLTTQDASPPPVAPIPTVQKVTPAVDETQLVSINTEKLAKGTAPAANQWTAAYREAVDQLRDDVRVLICKEQDVHDMFSELEKTNEENRNTSWLRQGLVMMQGPLQYVNVMRGVGQSVAGLDTGVSAAFGIIDSVITLANGLVQVEASFKSEIESMLNQMKVIDGCDSVSQKYGKDAADVHDALVKVYSDMLQFYYAVIKVLTSNSTVLSLISEQFKEDIASVVQTFAAHSKILDRLIQGAMAVTTKNIESLLIESEITKLLGSAKVQQVEHVHLTQRKRMAVKACEWVLEEESFKKWRVGRTSQPLLVYGAMGCGKSATMTYMINHIKEINHDKRRIPVPIVCYHYCRDDESGNVLNILSTLIQQLMNRRRQCKVDFKEWVDKHTSEGTHGPTQDPALLAQFFFQAISISERPTFVFLDGLDECDEQSRRDLLDLCAAHAPSTPGLKLCISARQEILKSALQIHIEPNRQRDEAIVSHMVYDRLSSLHPTAKTTIITTLSGLANGSAIWVRLTIDLLALRGNMAPAKLEACLRKDLSDSKLPAVYAKLFNQVTGGDSQNRQVLTQALEILACAERPLTVSELGWAVALKGAGASVNDVKCVETYVESERVLKLLGPFIANVDPEEKTARQVRLVHQSLREQIFKSSPTLWHESHTVVLERRSTLHDETARLCMQYLLLHDIQELDLFSDEQVTTQVLDQLPGGDVFGSESAVDSEEVDEPVNYFDPSKRGFGEFFTYASCYWLHHMRKAGSESRAYLSDIVALTTDSRSWQEQFFRPECTVKADESQPRPSVLELWTLVSLYGSDALLSELLQTTSPPSNTFDQKRNAIKMLLAMGDLRRIPLLIGYKRGEELLEAMELFKEVLFSWKKLPHQRRDGLNIVFDHIEGAFPIMVEQGWGNEVLCWASATGCIPFLERIFCAASDNPALKREILRAPHRGDGQSQAQHQSIGAAVWWGQSEAAAFLLKQHGINAHLRYTDKKGNNVFHQTVHAESSGIIKLLLKAFPDGVDQRDENGDTALQKFVFCRRHSLATLLLQDGHADVRCGYTGSLANYFEPLPTARRDPPDYEMMEILERIGGAEHREVLGFEDSRYRGMEPSAN